MKITADPNVLIEEEGDGWVRYFRITDGRRWEVHGKCDYRGHCLVGAVINGVMVRDLEHLKELGDRPDSKLDNPVSPEFKGCCPFTYVELENGYKTLLP